MLTRVVHVRLSNTTIVACYDLIKELGGISSDNMPMSKAVRIVVEQVTRQYQQDQTIRVRSDAEATAFLDQIESVKERWKAPGKPKWNIDEGLHEGVGKDVEAVIEQLSNPNIEGELELYEVETQEQESTLDLTEAERKDFEELEAEAPKDIYIRQIREQIDKDEINPQVQAALEIVYSNMPRSDWGSAKAKRNIDSLLRQAGVGG